MSNFVVSNAPVDGLALAEAKVAMVAIVKFTLLHIKAQ